MSANQHVISKLVMDLTPLSIIFWLYHGKIESVVLWLACLILVQYIVGPSRGRRSIKLVFAFFFSAKHAAL
jgi:hypothetical protein